jgi:hypothetical protein
MSRLDPSILVRRMADLDDSFVSLGYVATAIVNGVEYKGTVTLSGGKILQRARSIPTSFSGSVVRGWTADDIEAAWDSAKYIMDRSAYPVTFRRKNPSFVPVMAQPMQHQATSSSPLQQEQAMAQSDQQRLPGKGEFGGLCGHETCTCENARFEYIDPRAEKRALGKFYCEWCANDKNRQALTFRSDRDYSPACVERTSAPTEEKKPDPKPQLDNHYWDMC